MSMALGMIDPQPAISRQISPSTSNLTLHKLFSFNVILCSYNNAINGKILVCCV